MHGPLCAQQQCQSVIISFASFTVPRKVIGPVRHVGAEGLFDTGSITDHCRAGAIIPTLLATHGAARYPNAPGLLTLPYHHSPPVCTLVNDRACTAANIKSHEAAVTKRAFRHHDSMSSLISAVCPGKRLNARGYTNLMFKFAVLDNLGWNKVERTQHWMPR